MNSSPRLPRQHHHQFHHRPAGGEISRPGGIWALRARLLHRRRRADRRSTTGCGSRRRASIRSARATANPIIRSTLGTSFLARHGLSLRQRRSSMRSSGPTLDFDNELILLALLTATANGLFDYSTALARARFEDARLWPARSREECSRLPAHRRRRLYLPLGGDGARGRRSRASSARCCSAAPALTDPGVRCRDAEIETVKHARRL